MDSLFEEYNQMIYQLSLKLTKNREEADNIFQETWLQVARHIHQLDESQNPKNWLYTILLEKVLLKNKHSARRAGISIRMMPIFVIAVANQWIRQFDLNLPLKRLIKNFLSGA